ncbi:MAG TPA: 8-amino-7-oxononanoate synthase [Candidatus Acidoferrales bacterium]|nr:8-amino-7-oxononanoate synthase [Candidatus Acidoferrales bacterium]
MTDIEEKLQKALEQRESDHSLRSLPDEHRGTPSDRLIDFCSNDYLGFSRSEILREKILQAERLYDDARIGSTGSRLISGNTRLCEELEDQIAKFHHAEAGLIFNSGYDANVGIFSSMPERTDTILYDQLVHASIRDGIRLSYARSFSFRHNDLAELERRLNAATGNIFVALESVYSMDGDCAPLVEISELCGRFDANLIVDEAHATGVFGEKGEGKVVELGIEEKIFARLHTFGKALGCHGSIVVGSEILRSYLINFARSFIYTTALPFHSLVAVKCAYEMLGSDPRPLHCLRNRISYFKKKTPKSLAERMIQSDSAIQSLIIPGNPVVREFADQIQKAGFDVRPILHPTVPSGSERLRICLHSFNQESEIDGLIETLSSQSS